MESDKCFVVLYPTGGIHSSWLDEELAKEHAKRLEGVVVSMPITHDFRENADER